MDSYKNPSPTVDAVIFWRGMDKVIMIERKNPPLGWALPGGFVNEGESLQDAVRREVQEELGINLVLLEQFFTYSRPDRDPRKHVMSTVFLATTTEPPIAGDDARSYDVFDLECLPGNIAFDHLHILRDVEAYLKFGFRRKLEVP